MQKQRNIRAADFLDTCAECVPQARLRGDDAAAGDHATSPAACAAAGGQPGRPEARRPRGSLPYPQASDPSLCRVEDKAAAWLPTSLAPPRLPSDFNARAEGISAKRRDAAPAARRSLRRDRDAALPRAPRSRTRSVAALPSSPMIQPPAAGEPASRLVVRQTAIEPVPATTPILPLKPEAARHQFGVVD